MVTIKIMWVYLFIFIQLSKCIQPTNYQRTKSILNRTTRETIDREMREPRQSEGPAAVSAGKCRPLFEYFDLYVFSITFVIQTRQDLRTTQAKCTALMFMFNFDSIKQW